MAASATGQPQFIASTGGNRSFSNAPLIKNEDADQIVVPDVSLLISCIFKLNKDHLYWT